MSKTNAEHMKTYRAKLKKDKTKYEAVKEKARARNNSIRAKLSGANLQEFRKKARLHQRKCRENKTKRLCSSSFKTRQSFGRSVKKVTASLPKCDRKKKIVVQHLAKQFGLISKSKHQPTSLQLN